MHHTEGGNVYTPEQAPGIVLAIAHYHRDTKGWNDVGYNFLVDRYGTIYEGRAGGIDHAVVGAHAQGFNRFSTGIAILGSFTSELPPDAALAAVARLIAWKLPLHGTPVTGEITVTAGGGSLSRYGYGAKVPLQRISGHRDGDSTDCPGTALYGQLPALRARTAAAVQIVPAAPRVALTGPATTPFGTLAQVTGSVVNPDGSPAVAAAVAIQKIGPSGAWSTITRVQAATDGTFAAAVPARRAGTIRARALQQTSPPLSVGVTPVLQARVDLPLVALGRAFHVRGSVGPAGPVRVVVERRETGGAWQPALVQTVVVGRSGRFAATVRLARRGHFRVTVTTLAPSAAVTAGPFPVRIVSPERLGGVATPR